MNPLTAQEAAELLGTINDHGYAVVPGVIPLAEFSRLDEIVARVNAEYRARRRTG